MNGQCAQHNVMAIRVAHCKVHSLMSIHERYFATVQLIKVESRIHSQIHEFIDHSCLSRPSDIDIRNLQGAVCIAPLSIHLF